MRIVLAATIVIALGYLLAFAGARGARLGAGLLAVGLAALIPATMALGAPLSGPRGRVVRIALWSTGLVLLAAFGVALALPANEDAATSLILGFPLRAAIVLYGAGVLPLVVLPLIYAWTFDDRSIGSVVPDESLSTPAVAPPPQPAGRP